MYLNGACDDLYQKIAQYLKSFFSINTVQMILGLFDEFTGADDLYQSREPL